MKHSSNLAVTHGGELLNSADDIAWLRSTHLKGMNVKPFRSFVVIGNEDAPDAVYLYDHEDPLISDTARLIDFSEVTA